MEAQVLAVVKVGHEFLRQVLAEHLRPPRVIIIVICIIIMFMISLRVLCLFCVVCCLFVVVYLRPPRVCAKSGEPEQNAACLPCMACVRDFSQARWSWMFVCLRCRLIVSDASETKRMSGDMPNLGPVHSAKVQRDPRILRGASSRAPLCLSRLGGGPAGASVGCCFLFVGLIMFMICLCLFCWGGLGRGVLLDLLDRLVLLGLGGCSQASRAGLGIHL